MCILKPCPCLQVPHKYLATMGVPCIALDATTNACRSYLPLWVLQAMVRTLEFLRFGLGLKQT